MVEVNPPTTELRCVHCALVPLELFCRLFGGSLKLTHTVEVSPYRCLQSAVEVKQTCFSAFFPLSEVEETVWVSKYIPRQDDTEVVEVTGNPARYCSHHRILLIMIRASRAVIACQVLRRQVSCGILSAC
jgi:hypothetical protein